MLFHGLHLHVNPAIFDFFSYQNTNGMFVADLLGYYGSIWRV